MVEQFSALDISRIPQIINHPLYTYRYTRFPFCVQIYFL